MWLKTWLVRYGGPLTAGLQRRAVPMARCSGVATPGGARSLGALAAVASASPVDHGARGDEADDPHRAAALRAAQQVDLVDLPQQLSPPPPRLPQRERHGVGDGERGVRRAHGLAPRPAHAIGVIAIVAGHDLMLVRNVRRHAQSVGARSGALLRGPLLSAYLPS